MTCTQQRLDRRPANPVLSGDVTLDGRDEHGLQSTIHCLRGSMDSRRKTYQKLAFCPRRPRGRSRHGGAGCGCAERAAGSRALGTVQTVSFLPVFSWDPVSGADKYNFVLAADAALQLACVPLLGTKNTRATPDTTVPNGTYWWRVQAVDANGNTSPWSAPRSIEKLWADSPTLTSPDDGRGHRFPGRAAGSPLGSGPGRRQVQRRDRE